MKETNESQYVKRTQQDYSYAFKLAVVQEVENGELGIKAAARKYGIQSHSTITTWLRKYGKLTGLPKLDK
ncbi:helix-turn-helix domain-containing protein [Emticicia soli]|uniref:Transposase n=1 Tax=Emticicia soli TaxID=2027878 RepID=A0ABW5J429_9BACT